MLGLHGFEFNCNFFSGDDIGTEVDVTERAGTDFAADAVLVTDAEILTSC